MNYITRAMESVIATPTSRSRSSSVSSTSSTASSEAPIVPFPFFDLPYELRTQILENILRVPRVIDIDFNVSGITSIFLVSKQFHEESSAVFFGRNTFRLFPTHSKAARKSAQPLIRQFPQKYRKMITKVEYRLGPFWTNPPLCWKIDMKLGLRDLVRLKRLDVFVQCDPAAPMYRGFRKSETFYTVFAAKLLEQMLKRMQAVEEVRLDWYDGVSPAGPLIQKVIELAQNAGKTVVYKHDWIIPFAQQQLSEKLALLDLSGSNSVVAPSLHLLTPQA